MKRLLNQVDRVIDEFNSEFGMDQHKHLRFQLTLLRDMIVTQLHVTKNLKEVNNHEQ